MRLIFAMKTILSVSVIVLIVFCTASVPSNNVISDSNSIKVEKNTDNKHSTLPASQGNSKIASKWKTSGSKTRRILAVFPYQGKSHHLFIHGVLKILLEQGHHVTMFTSFSMKDPFGNYKEILFKPDIASWTDIFEFERMTTQTSWEARVDLEKLSESFLFPLYRSEEFKQLLLSDEEFDLVLLEPFFMQEPLVFLGHRFKCPVVGLATAITETNQDLYMGRTRNPSVELEWTTCAKSSNMNFYQRATNTFIWLANILENRFYYLPKREADFFNMVSYPGMNSLPPLSDLLSKISLTFSNSHQLVQHPSAVPPNLIMIPGLHISPDVTLPEDINSLMESAKDGVILFVMGTMVPVSKMKREKDIFIEALSRLRQLVLWKSDVDLPNLPKNIRTFQWLPQQAILAHKNCLAFITHGGMLSKQEAVYFGVPLVSIPLFGDQLSNTGHSEAAGLGLTLLYTNLTVGNLYSTINTVLNDKQFSRRMTEKSKIFRDVVATSKSKTLYWLNHVMDHNGAAYLRRDDLDITWIQYYLLDVIAVFILIIVVVITIFVKCAQGLYRIRFPAKNPHDAKIKKN